VRGSSARCRDVRPPPAPRIAECGIDWDALGPQPKSVPVGWGATMGSPFATNGHPPAPVSVLLLSDRITRQRVGSTQQLVLAGTRWGSSARRADMFVPRPQTSGSFNAIAPPGVCGRGLRGSRTNESGGSSSKKKSPQRRSERLKRKIATTRFSRFGGPETSNVRSQCLKDRPGRCSDASDGQVRLAICEP